MNEVSASTIILFGITGDLSRRKFIPALYNLVRLNILDETTKIIGVTRQNLTIDDVFGNTHFPTNNVDHGAISRLRKMIEIYPMDVTKIDDYRTLKKHIESLEKTNKAIANRIFYLSIPPTVAEPVITMIGEAQLSKSDSVNVRLLIEKPFGYDLESANELIDKTAKHFDEEQIFRIDHYLAKETVQNILAFRFNNPIFESLWNNQFIQRISIVASENIGIEGRVNFYEQTGALRDLTQSHLLQVLSLILLDRPQPLNAATLHEAKTEVLKQIATITDQNILKQTKRGQYDTYKQEVDNKHSLTETFAHIQLSVASDRWKNVPIEITTGKGLDKKEFRIDVTFFDKDDDQKFNVLTFHLQPHEGIDINLKVKKPGFDNKVVSSRLEFSYDNLEDDNHKPEAYERVLIDAIVGDRLLFASSEEVKESWRIVDNVIKYWALHSEGIITYPKGSSFVEVLLHEQISQK